MAKQSEWKYIQYMIIATFAFSGMELLVKSLDRIPTQQIVFFRAWIALVICWVMIRRAGLSLWGTNKKLLIARGATGTFALILYFYSLKTLPLATAAAIQKLSPLFTLLFAQILLNEKVRPANWFFFLLALAGAITIKGFDASLSLWAFSLAFLAAIFSGLAYNCIGLLKGKEHPLTIIFYFPLITLPIITPSTVSGWVAPNTSEWTMLIGVGCVVQFAQYFMTIAFSGPSTGKISIVYYFGTVLAVIWGYLLFNESLNSANGFGIGLILLALICNTLLMTSSKENKSNP